MIIASSDFPRVLSPSAFHLGGGRFSPVLAAVKILLLNLPTFFAKNANENTKTISELPSKGFSQVISDVFYSFFPKREDGITEKLNRLMLKINNSPIPSQHVNHNSLEFFKILFEKEAGFDLAIQVGQKTLFSEVPSEREAGTLLLKTLIGKNQKIEEAQDLVKQLILAKDTESLLIALEISSFLVQCGYDYTAALIATASGLSHDNQAVLIPTWKLQELLCRKKENWCFAEPFLAKSLFENSSLTSRTPEEQRKA